MSTSARLLTIMGSGETSPTMMKHHRDLIALLPVSAKAVVLDTPYGFQENAAELAEKAVEYFRKSVGYPIEIAGLTRIHGQDTLTVEQGLSRLRQADYLFAGPGSPSYALRQWTNTPVPEILKTKLRTGGAITFASAAALTLGRYTVPVYEIYKVGQEPHWLDGLNLLGEIGLDVAIIPHYDNAEGGHHDTHFCYLGERRLTILEEMLPDNAHVIGVDEHTGLIIDIANNLATIVGNGTVTVRIKGMSTVHQSGTVLSIEALRDPASGAINVGSLTTKNSVESSLPTMTTSLSEEVEKCERDFDQAMNSGDASNAARATLDLETAIHRWSSDTLQSRDMDTAHVVLRSMIVRLGDAAVGGLQDPREVISPYMDILMQLRTAVRSDKRYDLSDLIRDQLALVNIEVRDTPSGIEWIFNPFTQD